MIDLVLYQLNEHAPVFWRVNALQLDEISGFDMTGSYEWVKDKVASAVRAQYGSSDSQYAYVIATYPGEVVFAVEAQGSEKFYRASYTIENGEIKLGTPSEVEIKTVVVQKTQEALKALTRRMVEVGRRNNREDEQRLKKILTLVKELLSSDAYNEAEFARVHNSRMDEASLKGKDREKLRKAQQSRAKKYGIAPKPGGNLTKPKEYSNIPDNLFADPVNYKWPIDRAHIRPAVQYFNHANMRSAGGYTASEWAKIGKRIAQAASKFFGVKYEYRNGKIVRAEEK